MVRAAILQHFSINKATWYILQVHFPILSIFSFVCTLAFEKNAKVLENGGTVLGEFC